MFVNFVLSSASEQHASSLEEPQAKILKYFELRTNVTIPYEKLVIQKIYRLVHSDGVARMKVELLANGFSIQHPLIVKRAVPMDQDPQNNGPFVVVDGMHRLTAIREIIQDVGMEVATQRILLQGLPCLTLRFDTPEFLLIQLANQSNAANTQYTPMSWMDSVLNCVKLAISSGDHSAVWVMQSYRTLFEQSGQSPQLWTDFQKKMGIAAWCCLKQDADALVKSPLYYRDGETERTMFSIALLMDELSYDDTCKFRELYKSQLGHDFLSKIGDYNEVVYANHRVFKESSMYPGLFTRGAKSSKKDTVDEYLRVSSLPSAQLLMKVYFVIGRWIMQPKATKIELDKMRLDINNYVTQTKKLLKLL